MNLFSVEGQGSWMLFARRPATQMHGLMMWLCRTHPFFLSCVIVSVEVQRFCRCWLRDPHFGGCRAFGAQGTPNFRQTSLRPCSTAWRAYGLLFGDGLRPPENLWQNVLGERSGRAVEQAGQLSAARGASSGLSLKSEHKNRGPQTDGT